MAIKSGRPVTRGNGQQASPRENVRAFHLKRIAQIPADDDETYFDQACAYFRAVMARLPGHRRVVGKELIDKANGLSKEIR